MLMAKGKIIVNCWKELFHKKKVLHWFGFCLSVCLSVHLSFSSQKITSSSIIQR